MWHVDFPGSSDGKESAWCGRYRFDPRVEKIPWRREWLPTPVFLPWHTHTHTHTQNVSSLTRHQTHAPGIGAHSLNHWTTREVLLLLLFGLQLQHNFFFHPNILCKTQFAFSSITNQTLTQVLTIFCKPLSFPEKLTGHPVWLRSYSLVLVVF